MDKYTKKPVEIEAIQWSGTTEEAKRIVEWSTEHGADVQHVYPLEPDPNCLQPHFHETHVYCPCCRFRNVKAHLSIRTLDSRMEVAPGMWVIKGVKGEFYSCPDDVFQATYSKSVETNPREN